MPVALKDNKGNLVNVSPLTKYIGQQLATENLKGMSPNDFYDPAKYNDRVITYFNDFGMVASKYADLQRNNKNSAFAQEQDYADQLNSDVQDKLQEMDSFYASELLCETENQPAPPFG